MSILLGDFNAKFGGEDIFQLTVGSENLREDNNINGVWINTWEKMGIQWSSASALHRLQESLWFS